MLKKEDIMKISEKIDKQKIMIASLLVTAY